MLTVVERMSKQRRVRCMVDLRGIDVTVGTS